MKQSIDLCWVADRQKQEDDIAGRKVSSHRVATLLLLPLMMLLLMVAAATQCYADLPGFLLETVGNLKGQVALEGVTTPEEGYIVSFFNSSEGFPPTEGSLRRVPDMVSRSDKEGRFEVKLLPGKYYMGFMIRALNAGVGPPKPGERYFFVRDDKGTLRTLEVITQETRDVGMVTGQEPGAFKEFKEFFTAEGTLYNEDGKPLEKAMILVKTNVDAPRPLYMHLFSGSDGKYSIKLPTGLAYYLVVRQSIQGRPEAGTLVGMYGKNAPSQMAGKDGIGAPVGVSGKGGEGEALPVKGKPGDVIKGVDIKLFKIPDPDENRKKYLKERQELMESQGKK